MTTQLRREWARYIMRGRLNTTTALHVGSGHGDARTDATVVRDAWGVPFLPGSSFKGALRSAVERLVAALPATGLTTCQLSPGHPACLSTNREWQRAYEELREQVETVGEQALCDFLDGEMGLCDTCRLFGSPYSQSRLLVSDLPLAEKSLDGLGQIRHGVGIDRETLTARENIKFDFETLPPQIAFEVELVLERPSPLDLGLLALGLQEMVRGDVPLGGIRTRGLGRCTLELDEVCRLPLDDRRALFAYLRRGPGEELRAAASPAAFLEAALDGLERLLQGGDDV